MMFVIAILISILVLAVITAQRTALLVQCQSNLHQLGLAVLQYRDVNGAFPQYRAEEPALTNACGVFRPRWPWLLAPHLGGTTQDSDAIAALIAHGGSNLEGWKRVASLLRSEKSEKAPDPFSAPRLLQDPLEAVPNARGVYLLSEKSRPLYARATINLRRGAELHRLPSALAAITEKLWHPDLDQLTLSYTLVAGQESLEPAETRIIEEKKPIFNVPRTAA